MKGVCCGLFAIIITPFAAPQTFHTTPDRWKEPRIFHAALDGSPNPQEYRRRVKLTHAPPGIAVTSGELSPNRAYWFFNHHPKCEGARRVNRTITVFTERPYMLQVALEDADCRYPGEVRWINEKLLFVRVWWGRVLGSDLIVDVESGKLLYHEFAHDGGLAFQQWQKSPQ